MNNIAQSARKQSPNDKNIIEQLLRVCNFFLVMNEISEKNLFII